jgi:membrane fusion protein (multidrug efflux system)
MSQQDVPSQEHENHAELVRAGRRATDRRVDVNANGKGDANPQQKPAGTAPTANPQESTPEQNNSGKADDKTENQKDDKQEEKKPLDPATKRKRILIGVIVGAVVLVAALGWYLYSGTYENTDDAQIDGHLNPIASRVGGTVKAVYVENDQPVKAGQPLVDLDPKDYEVQVAQAKAAYEQALAKAAAQNPNVPITQLTNSSTVEMDEATVVNAQAAVASAEQDYTSNLAKLRQAEANNRKSQQDLARYKKLADEQEISQSDYDQYVANASAQQADVEAAQAAADSYAKIIDQRKAQLRQEQTKLSEDKLNSPRQLVIQRANVNSSIAAVDSAKAQLDAALLNLSYCHIVAPVDGIATERSAEVGARVAEGQQLIVISQTDNQWVTADFKETQLMKMKIGQRVTFKVDALDETFEGKVQDMPAATGDRGSLFPPENATGNYVKVVQRLPVRISIDPNQRDYDRLRPGMSVEPTVHF